ILQHCHRQAGPLKHNCTAILRGRVAESEKFPNGEPGGPWFVHGGLENPDRLTQVIMELFETVIPSWGFDPIRQTQFLTAMRKPDAIVGTRAVNLLLQKLHQRRLGNEVAPVTDDSIRPPLYPGDKVIQTKNNYELDIMNGHQGVVVQMKPLVIQF